MQVEIKKSFPKGTIKAPPSKSYSHRYLILGALSNSSVISNYSPSNDLEATLSCLDSLGYRYEIKLDKVIFKGNKEKNNIFNCIESGSTLRFFIPLILAISHEGTLKGSKKLFSRGLDEYIKIFDKQNIKYILKEDSLYIKGNLKPGKYELNVDKSSQFVSGLLLALPLLNGDSEIHLLGKIESLNYIKITIDSLKRFGIEIKKVGNIIYIKGNQIPKTRKITIEGDYSNAAFLEALNYIEGDVKITGLKKKSLQGDKKYLKYFPLIKEGHPTINIKNCIDLGPILFTLSSIYHGATIKGTNRLRIKESDRIIDVLSTLEKFGVKYKIFNDKVEIYKSNIHKVDECIDVPNDHRIVMALSILLIKLGGKMNNVEAINKSYPNFFKDLEKINVKVKVYE